MSIASRRRLAIFGLLCASSGLWADQVTLKNGDRISGVIVKYDGKNLVLKSELAGDMTIPWSAVTDLKSTEPVNVGLKGGQQLVGTVQTAADKISVTTKEAGTVTAPRADIEYIRSQPEEAVYQAQLERYRNPRLTDLWTGFLDLGFAQSGGNAETQTFNLTANAARTTPRDKMSAYFTSIYSSGTVGGVSGVVTANAKRGGIAYNINLTKKVFGFGSVDLENDEFQSLDLRFAPAGGLGYHVIATDTTMLDLQAGGALNREFFNTGLNRTHGEGLVGQVFMHKFSKISTVQEKFFYFPGFSSSSNRMNFDLSLVTALRKWLGWQLSFSDRYLGDPIAGRKKNDTLFTTGLRLTFAQ